MVYNNSNKKVFLTDVSQANHLLADSKKNKKGDGRSKSKKTKVSFYIDTEDPHENAIYQILNEMTARKSFFILNCIDYYLKSNPRVLEFLYVSDVEMSENIILKSVTSIADSSILEDLNKPRKVSEHNLSKNEGSHLLKQVEEMLAILKQNGLSLPSQPTVVAPTIVENVPSEQPVFVDNETNYEDVGMDDLEDDLLAGLDMF